MVNGQSMLPSASFSLLSSPALPPLNATPGTTEPPAGGQATPDFADVLKATSGQAGTPIADGQPGQTGQLTAVVTGSDSSIVPLDAQDAAGGEPMQAASMAAAAAASGKILPVALPETANSEAGPKLQAGDARAASAGTPARKRPADLADLGSALPTPPAAMIVAGPTDMEDRQESSAKDARMEPVAAVVAPLPALPGPVILMDPPVGSPETAAAGEQPESPSGVARNAPPAAAVATLAVQPDAETATTLPAVRAAQASADLTVALTPFAPIVAAETARKPKAADGQTTDARAAATVQVSFAARPPATDAPVEPATRPKAARPTERTGVDAPAQPERAPAALPAAVQPDSAQSVTTAWTANAPAPSPADINAALDRLLAAREALLPAEAALAVDHADFGEVSIRFERSSDGRLSAELSAADPDLQRAATAAMAADGGLSANSEGAGGRSTSLANPRGSGPGTEAAPDGRGHPGNDRELDRRRTPGRPPTGAGTSEPRSGIFA